VRASRGSIFQRRQKKSISAAVKALICVDRLDHPLVVLEGPIRMMPAHDVRFAGARLDHAEHVLDGVLEGAVLALLAREVAEAA
jgi:hypothetical protein